MLVTWQQSAARAPQPHAPRRAGAACRARQPVARGGQHCVARTAAAALHPIQHVLQQHQQRLLQQRHHQHRGQALINSDVATSESWPLDARAAILNLKVEQLEQCIQDDPNNAWLALCEPERLFGLQAAAKLLELDVPSMLRLAQQEPGLLEVPCTSLEEHFRGLQALLQLPRPQLLALLLQAPGLLVQGPRAVQAQVQRIAGSLGLAGAGPDAARLLQLLPWLGGDWAGDAAPLVQQLQAFARALCLSPSDALTVLQAEQLSTRAPASLLVDATVKGLAADWGLFCQDVGLPQRDVMAALAAQMAAPGARYNIRSVQQLREDLAGLQAACQLGLREVLGMLLAAPGLVAVPASFWRLLLQYVLFLVPQWRQQLHAMTPAQAGALLAQLCEATSGVDRVTVTQQDGLFASADVAYNSELSVLEALLDEGMRAPAFEGPGEITAAKFWRLLYLCNPRLAAQQQQLQDGDGQQQQAAGSPWSWVTRLQLPLPLITQLQARGALACDLQGPGASQAGCSDWAPAGPGLAPASAPAGAASGAPPPAETIPSLWEAAAADTEAFVARHPGYGHWLYNAVFELEWQGSRAAAPAATWDP